MKANESPCEDEICNSRQQQHDPVHSDRATNRNDSPPSRRSRTEPATARIEDDSGLLIISTLIVFASNSFPQVAPTFYRSDITVGNSPASLAVGDINGDGKPDMAVLANTISTASVSIYLSNGDGTFNFKTSFSSGFTSVWIAAGDLNGDGFADLVIANGYSRSVSVFL